ncbi:MAG: nuclear transport factor 2 family protein [Chitinophagaceae bacterium]|nr:nuclear transport factor 2 family protein [Chitinophagaceae bacterium]
MKKLSIVALVCLFTTAAKAQSATDSVKQVVNQLFTAMKTADAQLLQQCFADSAVLQTIATNKEGKTIVRNESVAAFAASISKAPVGALDERIEFDMVKTDAALAIVWTPYQFYLNGNFSHCGVNSFQLVRFNGQWKIQYLIDTRRRTGCR